MVVPRFKRSADTIPVQKTTLASLVGALGLSWLLVLYLYLSQPAASSSGSNSIRGLNQDPIRDHHMHIIGFSDDGALPVLGTLQTIGSGKQQTEMVYALPTGGDIKATALLLHGCGHHGRNFFSQSPTCERCLGLSEELRIARILLEQNSIAVLAITSHDRKTACWSDVDFEHVQQALTQFQQQHSATGPVVALGTSSGGVFGVQLAVRGIVNAALVGVMHLRDELIQKWLAMDKPPPVYLAPMPRDTEKMEKVEANFAIMNGHGPAVLDKETCQSRPVDASYLNERVPQLSISAAQAIVHDLMDAGHIDKVTGLLVKDPTNTETNWREVLKNNCGSQGCLENQSLEVGFSPLAKALNRAWAFHDYCSEVTIKALTYFEKELGGTPFLHTWQQA